MTEPARPKKGRPLLENLDYRAVASRNLSLETCRKWQYGQVREGKTDYQVAQYYDASGRLVAQKTKTLRLDDEGNPKKHFGWRGDSSKSGLFGQHLWKEGRGKLIITEGEIDAMSVSQAQDHRWPVVSVPGGAQSAAKAIQDNIEFVESFDTVVLMFDQDDAGRKAAVKVAETLTPGKAHIATLDAKDANELLVAGRANEITEAFWGAKPYRPDGIVNGNDLMDRILEYQHLTQQGVDYPWEILNTPTRGQRPCEITMWTGGTGTGKSETVRQVALDLHNRHHRTVGIIALEEPVEKTAVALLGMNNGRRLTLEEGLQEGELRDMFTGLFASERLYMYDHFGSLDSANLFSRIRYLVKACGCQDIILDHISIAVSGLDTGDERKDIDVLMTKLRSLVEELKISLHAVCHLRRVNGISHEEGSAVSLHHLRGSQSLIQIPDNIIALERNQQADDLDERNVTRVRVLKCRWTGDLGAAGWLRYDKDTGLQSETADPEKAAAFDDEEDY